MKFSIFILVVVLAFALTVNGWPVDFEKRRFGQEHSDKAEAVYACMNDQAAAANKELEKAGQGVNAGIQFEATAGALVNQTVFSLLAKASACDQQKAADNCLDLRDDIKTALDATNSTKVGKITKTLKDCCIKLRQLERNTNAIGKKSELCTEKPKHKELDGLTQAQDPSAKDDKPKKSKPTCTEKTTTPTPTPTLPA